MYYRPSGDIIILRTILPSSGRYNHPPVDFSRHRSNLLYQDPRAANHIRTSFRLTRTTSIQRRDYLLKNKRSADNDVSFLDSRVSRGGRGSFIFRPIWGSRTSACHRLLSSGLREPIREVRHYGHFSEFEFTMMKWVMEQHVCLFFLLFFLLSFSIRKQVRSTANR